MNAPSISKQTPVVLQRENAIWLSRRRHARAVLNSMMDSTFCACSPDNVMERTQCSRVYSSIPCTADSDAPSLHLIAIYKPIQRSRIACECTKHPRHKGNTLWAECANMEHAQCSCISVALGVLKRQESSAPLCLHIGNAHNAPHHKCTNHQ